MKNKLSKKSLKNIQHRGTFFPIVKLHNQNFYKNCEYITL
ncbi:hypothetical protein LR69_03468 [Geobacillus sp. BCO2]|nr:hypothetical protein LR69_03468 [Geobacillus sp. BCO2]